MSTRQPNSQTPSTKNASAMASHLDSTSADKDQKAGSDSRNVVVGGPTIAQELRSLIARRRLSGRLAEIIDLATWVEVRRDTGHHGPDHILELRKSLFKAQVANAKEYLAILLTCEDDDDPWEFDADLWEFVDWADGAIAALAKAIAYHLDLPPTKSWSVDGLIEVIGRLER